jgi:HlyD family secretion protein
MSAVRKGIYAVGTQLDPVPDPQLSAPEAVRWIGRERPSLERIAEPVPAPTMQRPASRMKWVIGVGALVALVIMVTAWKLLSGSKGPSTTLADRGAIPLVTVMVPALQAVTSQVTFTGAIAARYDMPIANEGDTGRIVAVYVEAGDHVKRGQILAKIDDSVLVQQVNRLAASLEQAKAQADLSAAEYKRALGVQAAGALSAEDIEKRRATAVTDAANVKVVAAQLAEADARLARTRITAPIDGTVLTRNVEAGQIAPPGGATLFRVASGGEVEMRGQIAEQDLAQVQVGQAATVYLTGLSRPFAGKVRLLGAIIDPQTRLGDIRIQLQPDPALRPGAFARAEVTIAKAQRPVLPKTAVFADSDGSYVIMVDAEGHATRHAVTVVDTSDDGVVIGSGLKGNEQVVKSAGGFLREGESVKTTAADPQAPPP